jgi:hypothetical protein
MKKITYLATIILVFWVVAKAQADVVDWDWNQDGTVETYHQYNFQTIAVDGYLYSFPPFVSMPMPQGGLQQWPLGQSGFSSTSQIGDSQLGGDLETKTMARGPLGGNNPTDSLQVQGSSEINIGPGFSGNGALIKNQLISFQTRRFLSKNDGDYLFKATLEGPPIAFDSFFESDTNQAWYQFKAEVALKELVLSLGNDVMSQDIVFTQTLDDENRDWSGRYPLVTQRGGNTIAYELQVGLDITTHAQNLDQFFVDGTLSGPYQVGTAEDPLILTATVVPIPGSVILLATGLGGLAAFRRRWKL